MIAIINWGQCKLNEKPGVDRAHICSAANNLQSIHRDSPLLLVVTRNYTYFRYVRYSAIANQYDAYDSINAKLQFARGETTIIIGKSSDRLDSGKKGWVAVVMGATLQPPTLGEYSSAAAAAAIPVSETHFQFNAIVQNQLPRSSRNIRAKFTAESVLLARHRPNLSRLVHGSQPSNPWDFNSRNYSHLGCRPARTFGSQNHHETAVEIAALARTAKGDFDSVCVSLSLSLSLPFSTSLMPGIPANSLYCGTWPIRAIRLQG